MRLYYQNLPILDNKILMNELLDTGSEFAYILFNKFKQAHSHYGIVRYYGNNDQNEIVNFFAIQSKKNNSVIDANGSFIYSDYYLNEIKKSKNIEHLNIEYINDISILLPYINSNTLAKTEQILADFYILKNDTIVQDKNGKYWKDCS